VRLQGSISAIRGTILRESAEKAIPRLNISICRFTMQSTQSSGHRRRPSEQPDLATESPRDLEHAAIFSGTGHKIGDVGPS
jgi:hypothetical protein